MVVVGVRIRGLEDLRELYPAVEAATLASAQIASEHALGRQEAEHLLAHDPTGKEQKPNAESTRNQKEIGWRPNTVSEEIKIRKRIAIGDSVMVIEGTKTKYTTTAAIGPVVPNVPLRRTGAFMSRSSWKVKYDAKKKRVRVGPYGVRARMIAGQARELGYRLLPDGLPASSLTVGRTWLQRRLDIISRRHR